jgi:hypothetical protein
MTNLRAVFHAIATPTLSGCITSTLVQGVSVPDSALFAVIRVVLQKPSGPLTEQDLLSLTILDASAQNISKVEGLEAARNFTLFEGNPLSIPYCQLTPVTSRLLGASWEHRKL